MNIEDLLHPILRNTIPLRPEDSPQTVPEWDSFAQVNIIAAIEDAAGAELSTNDVMSLDSVRAVIAVCKAHGLDITINKAA